MAAVVAFAAPAAAYAAPARAHAAAPVYLRDTVTYRAPEEETRAWSVRPADADGKPDARTHYTLQGAPGATVTEKALVTNLSKVPVTFAVYGTDAFNTATGQFDLLSADHKPTDIGSWMVFDNSTITLPAGASAAVPFKISLPPTATPGDHVGGVVVSLVNLNAGSGQKVNVDARVAVRTYLRIPGNYRPRFGVGPVTATYQRVSNPFGHGKVEVTYTVSNTGNIRMQGHPTITVTGPFGNELGKLTPKDLPELLPNQSATFTSTVEHVFPGGPLTVKVSVAPFTDPLQPVGQDLPEVSGEGQVWAMPWNLLILIALLLVIVAALWWRFRRRLLSRLDAATRAVRERTLQEVSAGKTGAYKVGAGRSGPKGGAA